ncbi:hypothetical protein [Bacillus sp. B15-48]|uniref:hypothetical protein n=1 Tax=Bacillus sp. B15-48 TaxID=1548601 RepID=UPI00193F14F0|nr:hypothetical protein [Bacillus sp. B15-48]MBM4761169.1 hypothetical protein [Bacillus sp. B15-48]
MLAFLRIGMILISWGTVFFLPKKMFFKFLPVSLFSSIIILTEYLVGAPRNWWAAKGGMKTIANNGLMFTFGPYFIGNIWIFSLTYRKFWLYTLLNIMMDYILAYPLNAFFEKINLYKLKKLRPIHLFLLSLGYSFVNYGFQLFVDKNQPVPPK